LQAHEIFEARKVLEPTIARMAVVRATPAEINSLKTHLSAEFDAQESGNRRELIVSANFSAPFAVECAVA
jgi:DNA-binding GntR family transcriptional regulator